MKFNLRFVASALLVLGMTGCGRVVQSTRLTEHTSYRNNKGPSVQTTQSTTSGAKPPQTNIDQNPTPIKRLLIWDSATMQSHFFDNADSVWTDGDWHDKNGRFGPRYVATFYGTKTDPKQSEISILNLNEQSYRNFKCPRDIGHIAISSIADSGTNKWILLQFVSTSGSRGTFNLKTHQWAFVTNADKSNFANIDPIRPLPTNQPRFNGATSAWIDGDWHQSGGFGARYVSAYPGTKGKFAYFTVTYMNRGSKDGYFPEHLPLVKTFHCPKNIGNITVSNIVSNGAIIDFTSSSGVRGTWTIDTNSWSFN